MGAYGPVRSSRRNPVTLMIKDIMVRLEGTLADDVRLAGAADIARHFDGYIVGLFLNVLPPPTPPDPEGIALSQTTLLIEEARTAGDRVVELLTERLAQLATPAEVRRLDVFPSEIASTAAREARSADTFVALRPSGVPEEAQHIVESVLFGSGRHVFLVPPGERREMRFDNILLAWNGSREAARALVEARPILREAQSVTICVVDDDEPVVGARVPLGADVKRHLKHHGIDAALNRLRSHKSDVAETLIAETQRQKADLLVMGGYGHSRLREWLLGGVTYELLQRAPIPLLVAH
jgi:nucleotide-binding universal stress UspA family protein